MPEPTSEQTVQVELTREEAETLSAELNGPQQSWTDPKVYNSGANKIRAALSSPQGPEGGGSEGIARLDYVIPDGHQAGVMDFRDDGEYVRFTDHQASLQVEREAASRKLQEERENHGQTHEFQVQAEQRAEKAEQALAQERERVRQTMLSKEMRGVALAAFDAKPSLGFQRSFEAALGAVVAATLIPSEEGQGVIQLPDRCGGAGRFEDVPGAFGPVDCLGCPDCKPEKQPDPEPEGAPNFGKPTGNRCEGCERFEREGDEGWESRDMLDWCPDCFQPDPEEGREPEETVAVCFSGGPLDETGGFADLSCGPIHLDLPWERGSYIFTGTEGDGDGGWLNYEWRPLAEGEAFPDGPEALVRLGDPARELRRVQDRRVRALLELAEEGIDADAEALRRLLDGVDPVTSDSNPKRGGTDG
jgi:hypothetical protein